MTLSNRSCSSSFVQPYIHTYMQWDILLPSFLALNITIFLLMTQDRLFYDHFNLPYYILIYARGWYCSKRNKWMFYSRCLSWRQTFAAWCYLVIRQCRWPWWMFTQSFRLLNTIMYPECDGCPINLYVYDKTYISIQQLGWVYSSNSFTAP